MEAPFASYYGYDACDSVCPSGHGGYYGSSVYRNSCSGAGWCDNVPPPPIPPRCWYIYDWTCSSGPQWTYLWGDNCSDVGAPYCPPPCSPVNASLSGWGGCSAPCGGGTQTRTCSGASCGGDATCSNAALSQSCNAQACCTPDCSCAASTCSDSTCLDPNCGKICSGTKNCPPSASTNLQQSSNYCSAELVHILSWKFNDTSGDIQSKYRVQVGNNSNFSSLEVDSGEISSASASYTAPKLSSFNTLYYWRVMTWDSASQASPWSATANFTTYKHAWPLVKFSWNPSSPLKNQSTDFTDATTVYGGATKQSFLWAFQDATFSSGYSSAIPNTRVKFTSKGSKNVTLQVTDSDTYNCAATKAVTVTSSWLFNWKEIAP